jgi:hypothetical protein
MTQVPRLRHMPVSLFAAMETGWRHEPCSLTEANALLSSEHYLGPIRNPSFAFGSWLGGELMAVQAWGIPTSRRLPSDGSWLELKRWCISAAAPKNTGSRQHGAVAKHLRLRFRPVTTLVSYSDPSVGHTGALYRACGWKWSPTWLRLRPPPTGNGNWGKETTQHPKDRWVFEVAADDSRDDLLTVDDPGAIRAWLSRATSHEVRWAVSSPASDLRASVWGAPAHSYRRVG